jgi:putative RNA 2'-phosphotransferase
MDYVKLSKTISHALRHAPEEYGLTLDAQGWTPVETLLAALRHREYWKSLSEADLHAVQAANAKQRFEIAGGRIRALYGHSIAEKIEKLPQTPPALLYHGTVESAVAAIQRDGLQPMRRQYVHLSEDVATAEQVGARRRGRVRIFAVQALAAHEAGVAFYGEQNGVWLAEAIPAQFLSLSA